MGISWVDSSWGQMLNPGNVLDYFSERSNPFYDRTCNNEVVKMQRLTPDHLKYVQFKHVDVVVYFFLGDYTFLNDTFAQIKSSLLLFCV